MTHPSLDIGHWEDSVPGGILVAGGMHVTIKVQSGHLVITDGVPAKRRVRRLTRSQRTVKRVVNLGTNGYVTFGALAWMRGCGITFTQPLEEHGYHDWQAVTGQVYGSPDVIGYLIRAKVTGQADNLDVLGYPERAERVREKIHMPDYDVKNMESGAAMLYWNTWRKAVALPWSEADKRIVPEQWLTFNGRDSLVSVRPSANSATKTGASRHYHATDPVNAMLNFAYKVAETTCVEACHAVGLDPTLGLMHAPRDNRNSFALDLIEAVRPACDIRVIRLIKGARRFDVRWAHETRDGTCRIDEPLTHTICGWSGELFDAALLVAVECARILRKAGNRGAG